MLDSVDGFVADRCAVDLRGAGVDVAADVLVGFVGGGKCLRSTFMFLGWLCGAEASHAALRASASLELLHAFALLQDDVMDDSPLRRGQAVGPRAVRRLAPRPWAVRLRRSGSVNPPPSCSATCAWSGPNRCCATAASTTPR